jgi:hypothetical protein
MSATTTRQWFERARVALLVANIGWTTLCLGGYMPGTKVAMIVLTGALFAVHLIDPAQSGRPHPAGWLFVPFLFYAAANLAWVSPVRWIGWFDVLNWAQMVAIFWVVLNGVKSPGCRRLICVFLVVLGVVACGMSCYEHFVDPNWLMLGRKQHAQFIGRATGPFGIPNSMGVFMALLIPPVAYVSLDKQRPAWSRILGVLTLCALGTGFVLAISRGAWIALAGAFALRPLLAPELSFVRRISMAAVAVLAAVAIAAIVYFTFPLMHERVIQFVQDVGERTRPIMWRGTWKIFEAHRVWGGGAGCFDVLFEAYRPEGFRDEPVYSHCDYLNTLADYGVVGFVLFFGPAAYVGLRGSRARGLAAAAWIGLLAFWLHLLVDFHLKMPALAMISAAIAALVVQEAWPGKAEPTDSNTYRARPSLFAAWCTAAAVMSFVVFCAVPKYRAEKFRWAARETVDKLIIAGSDLAGAREAFTKVSAGLDRAVALDPIDGQAWSDRAYANSLWSHIDPARTSLLGPLVVADADKAIALCPVFAEFWIRKGSGLDMQHRWVEAGDCFVRALQIAPMRADVWYYEAFHLSLRPTEFGPAMEDANFCLRLDPGFLLAQALRQRLVLRLQQRL